MSDKILTHQKIDPAWSGTPQWVKGGTSQVVLTASAEMAVDEKGLVHGGFIFGLADHAAMIAVNDPNVVLGAATVKFLKPVKIGDTVTAAANIVETKGRKREVSVIVKRDSEPVFEGTFSCFVLDRHVLD